MRKVISLAVILLGGGCVGGNAPDRPPDSPSAFPDLGIVCSTYPHVDGSTSAQPLGMFLACKILNAGYEWALWESADTNRLHASEWFLFADPGYHGEKAQLCEWINGTVRHHGTHAAYTNLIRQRAEVILAARRPSDDEVKLAARSHVRLDVRAVARDAFVLLLHTANPVDDLSIEQIRGIYTGQIRRWNEVGGLDSEIRPFQRDRNSGSQELMQELVMGKQQMMPAPDMMVGTNMAEPFTMLDKEPNGIAYTVYFYQEHMAPSAQVKACAVNGVFPEARTIADGTYPFVTQVYVVVRSDTPAGSSALRLRDWLLSRTGQAIVQQCGYVPVGETDPQVVPDPEFFRHR